MSGKNQDHDERTKTFALQVDRRRRCLGNYLVAHGISQDDFAVMVGLSRQMMNYYINKKLSPNSLTALKIYYLTNGYISPRDLLTDRDYIIMKQFEIDFKKTAWNLSKEDII